MLEEIGGLYQTLVLILSLFLIPYNRLNYYYAQSSIFENIDQIYELDLLQIKSFLEREDNVK